MSTPSILMLPANCLLPRKILSAKVDLPDPVAPTRPTRSPAFHFSYSDRSVVTGKYHSPQCPD
jgi:hypothetical protein